jgi:predicted PurR-regulated permease PerM
MAGKIQVFVSGIEDQLSISLGLDQIVGNIVNADNLETIGQSMLEYLRNAGIILTKFLIGLILSYIFVIERQPIARFLSQMK